MHTGGVLEVHGNVTFEANSAGLHGGVVSLLFFTVLLLPVVEFCDRFVRVGLICWGSLPSPVGRVDVCANINPSGLIVELQSRWSLVSNAALCYLR
jgi:predicted outer membrane repeat protein